MLNTGLLSFRIRTPQRGISWAFINCPGHSPVRIVPGTGTMGPSPPTEVGPGLLSLCEAKGGFNAWLWYPTSLARGLGKTPQDTLDKCVSIYNPLRATSSASCWSATGSFCPHLEARSWSGLGPFCPEGDFWGQGGSWLLRISPADPWNHRNQRRPMGGEEGSEARWRICTGRNTGCLCTWTCVYAAGGRH